MTGFESGSSGIGSDRSANWATTTNIYHLLCKAIVKLAITGMQYIEGYIVDK